jgi:2-polyprenyl-3-methyl-5-hydroxy-6-metoxy-1,4-benzoquinol methylase
MPLNDFELDYQNKQTAPPWDIGHPQSEVVRIEEQGFISGNILDCGCGTGENTLYLASKGHHVLGIDFAPTAIAHAQKKAQERGVRADFQVADALNLVMLGQTFDTVLDCGLMHTLPDPEIRRYIQSLSEVMVPNGRFILLCFSEATIGGPGPLHRFSQADIHGFFQSGWQIEEIRDAVLETHFQPQVAAWLAIIHRESE